MEDEDRRTKRRRAAAAREQQTAYEFSRTPIYPGAKCSRLSYTILILNLQARFGCSNECISGIFRLLAERVLPEGSDVPNCRPEAKKHILPRMPNIEISDGYPRQDHPEEGFTSLSYYSKTSSYVPMPAIG
ncbi:hypothetical protein R1sor_000340 [Riccia sorocarpa]|uniref:Uncharacterized protein n=1 Tax=Riccia sorocarpa TaxID=122646 RepID=A0ABD3GT33_9MARC